MTRSARLALALALLLVSGPRVSAHEPAVLDPQRATPGIRLELVEVPDAAAGASTSRRYRLITHGVPADVAFNVWTRDFTHAFHEMLSGFRREGDRLVSPPDRAGRRHDLGDIVLDPGPYFRGAIWEVALVSEDRTISAFTRAIPRPMMARDGECVVTLELVSHRGQRFLASGRGFPPDADVVIESQAAGRVHRRRHHVAADGLIPPDVVTHVSTSPDRRARYTVTGRACRVTIEYEWGEDAFRRG